MNARFTPQRLTKTHPLKRWLLNHLRASLFGMGELIRAPLSSLFTLLVIGIAATLPATFYVLIANVQPLLNNWQGSPAISLYLKQDLPADALNQLMATLKNRPDVAAIRYISPEQGLQDFQQHTPFKTAIAALDHNPLPGVIVITPRMTNPNPERLQSLLDELQPQQSVAIAQLDKAWLWRLYYWIQIGHRITYSLALLFGIGIILIISNTIRLTTEQQHQDILVLKLIGATDRFIRRPLLYRGLLYGLFGGLLAWLFVTLMIVWISLPVTELSQSYQQNWTLHGLNFKAGLCLLLSCSLLGCLGSWLPARQYLQRPEEI